MAFDVEAFNELIRNRRSVKQFIKGKQVPEEIIRQALENATWAPNHGKTEPWQFVVFTGDGLRRLGEFQAELYKQEAGDAYIDAKYQNLLTTPLLASHIIAIGMKASGRMPEIEEIEAVACAVQNFHLTLTAYEIGGYWSSGGITYYEKAKPFFGLGENDRLLGFFSAGYIKVEPPQPPRIPIEEKVIWYR